MKTGLCYPRKKNGMLGRQKAKCGYSNGGTQVFTTSALQHGCLLLNSSKGDSLEKNFTPVMKSHACNQVLSRHLCHVWLIRSKSWPSPHSRKRKHTRVSTPGVGIMGPPWSPATKDSLSSDLELRFKLDGLRISRSRSSGLEKRLFPNWAISS